MSKAIIWGVEKGAIRRIDIRSGDEDSEDRAVYVIEEPPGYRDLKFSRKKHRIFFPWIYFFSEVGKGDHDLFWIHAFYGCISKVRVNDLGSKVLRYAPFPNSSGCGELCLPDQKIGFENPLECALHGVQLFWLSNGNEMRPSEVNVPHRLVNKKSKDWRRRIFAEWAALSPKEVMGLDWGRMPRGMESINDALSEMNWDCEDNF